MAKKPRASIKGMFVNSHVAALEKKKGPEAVKELQDRFGGPVHFESFEAVPLRDEVRILELSLDLMSDEALSGAERSAEAGRLHFRNFSKTPLGGALMRSMPHTVGAFRTLLINSPSIARIVFSSLTLTATLVAEGVCITIENCDYPPEHFAGFFEEWMRYWGLEHGKVETRVRAEGAVEYRLIF